MRTRLGLAGWIIGLGFSAGAVAARPARAQTARYFVPTLDSIGPGCCTIRIWQSGLQAQGKFQGRPDPESVLLGNCSGPLCEALVSSRLRLVPDALVEMQSGSHADRGLLIGALAGAGLLVGMIASCQDCELGTKEYFLVGAVGAAGGGAIGLLVGLLMPKWIPVRH